MTENKGLISHCSFQRAIANSPTVRYIDGDAGSIRTRYMHIRLRNFFCYYLNYRLEIFGF